MYISDEITIKPNVFDFILPLIIEVEAKPIKLGNVRFYQIKIAKSYDPNIISVIRATSSYEILPSIQFFFRIQLSVPVNFFVIYCVGELPADSATKNGKMYFHSYRSKNKADNFFQPFKLNIK